MLTEQNVLNRLNANSFREVSKDKIMDFVSMLPEMEPEVAKKAIEQFPEFMKESSKALATLKDTLIETIKAGDKSLEKSCQGYLITIDTLQRIIENDDLTFDEKMIVTKEMAELSRNIDATGEKHKEFLIDIAKHARDACGMLFAAGLLVLGVKYKIKL